MDSQPQAKGRQFAREARVGMLMIVTLIGVLAYVTIQRFSPEEPKQDSDLRAEAAEYFKDRPDKTNSRLAAASTSAQANDSEENRATIAGNFTNKAPFDFTPSDSSPSTRNRDVTVPGKTSMASSRQRNPRPKNPARTSPRKPIPRKKQEDPELEMPSISFGQEFDGESLADGNSMGTEFNPDELEPDEPTKSQAPIPEYAQANQSPAPKFATTIESQSQTRSQHPAASAVSVGNQSTQTITVECNDTFWEISQRVYGTGLFYRALHEYNRAKFKDINVLPIGSSVIAPPESILRSRYPRLIHIKSSISQTNFEQSSEEQDEQSESNPPIVKPNSKTDFAPALFPQKESTPPKIPAAFKPPSRPPASVNEKPALKPILKPASGQAELEPKEQPKSSPAKPPSEMKFAPKLEAAFGSSKPGEQPNPNPTKPIEGEISTVEVPSTYKVQAGDTLFDIARNELLQASRYLEILELNHDTLPKETTHLSPLSEGIELKMPTTK